ncbi:hypothetical protein G7B40_010240 [Aetokthonos hydrillicola Thurmond2011]|jgi:hypothetical protein|uniref:Transmembrane protein n=1 Tax=Aetokthonos hydrillicola Thurmond2011 TaxID=2712845 RepID=A0AAP5I581_9CYAN|nr:hypothetical protein [Aetokthonos hydrillicola]MBO3458992.1 hypothetical protein [Aetokthonos hydrillicola CCALA 1050]MBW4589100.1 hypothetical protein [Aetokthonos hydrillicola CCALA 1050]MDR9894944.1 hypothetical protein [Aetokthonos hydrillicola Thurmond2011]
MIPEIPPKRKARLEHWRKIPQTILKQMPGYDRVQIMAAIEEYAEHNLAKSQIAKYNAVRDRRLSRNQRQIAQFIVIIAGSLTLSIVPQLLAKQAGRGPLAISAGLIGGGVASFYAHANASKVLVGMKLKTETENTRKSILNQKH